MRKKLLCITTGFHRSGAPIALYGLLRILCRNDNYDISILAYEDGEMHTYYCDLIGTSNIELIDALPCTKEFRDKIQNEYDLVILNTSVVYPFLFFFQNTSIPVYWWIHESPNLIESSCPGFPNPNLLSPNFRLFASSSGAQEIFRSYYSYNNISVLPVPIFMPHHSVDTLSLSVPDDRCVFFIPAAYTYIKGQDILLKAIASLPANYIDRSFFVFCGYSLEKQSEYKSIIMQMASKLDNVVMLDNLSHEETMCIMDRSHCIVAPSRIDTIPMTIVEGMMLKKIALVSDSTGISHYIEDCQNGFVFKDHDDLVKRLLLIISDYENFTNIAENGHFIYKDFFSPDAVDKICSSIGL